MGISSTNFALELNSSGIKFIPISYKQPHKKQMEAVMAENLENSLFPFFTWTMVLLI